MRALCWHGKYDVRVDTVDDPKIEDPKDIIIKITASGICGSDLDLYSGAMPTMEEGDIIGHEPMGIVVEVGSAVRELSGLAGRATGARIFGLSGRTCQALG